MKTYNYDIRLDNDKLPMLVKECVVEYKAGMKHTNPEDIAAWLNYDIGMAHLSQEKLVGLYYDNAMRLIGYSEITTGTINSSLAPARETYQRALALGASWVIAAHNHPSGDSAPSSADIGALDVLKNAGRMIGINLLDFLIIGNGNYWSGRRGGYFEENE